MTWFIDDACGTGSQIDIGIGGSLPPLTYNPIGLNGILTIYNPDGVTIAGTESGVIAGFSCTGDDEGNTTFSIDWE